MTNGNAIGWDYLRHEQLSDGKVVPLRLILDVCTRWGSTLFMIERYLQLRRYVDKAVAKIYSQNFCFRQLRPSLPLTPAQIDSLQSCHMTAK